MTEIRTYDNADGVAKAAAENAIEILSSAIESYGRAVWVLAGGSSPMAAYKLLIKHHSEDLDWSKVTVLIGDERYLPLSHKDSNWGSIMKLFNDSLAFSEMERIEPEMLETVELTAQLYESQLKSLGIEHFDLVWVGVGEDGHTLSLFPGNDSLTNQTEAWVLPVHKSPKPPSERITLSLTALTNVAELVIFATGAAKKDVLREARLKGGLPIAIVAETVEASGGEVRWLYDDAAWGEA